MTNVSSGQYSFPAERNDRTDVRPKGYINRIYRNGNYAANACRWPDAF